MHNETIKFGRRLNPRTLMWEFSDGSGTPIPDEAMPRPGANVGEWLGTKNRYETMVMNGRQLGRTATHTHIMGTRAANAYMKARGIGESAVDLIPEGVRYPCGLIRTNNQFNWVHTPGRMKLGAILVRNVWSRA